MLRENTVNPNVQKAVEVLGRLSLNGSVRQEAKIREDALFNERSALSAARKEGREEGRKEGREEGRKEGREESIRAFIMDDLEEDIPKEHSIIKLQKYFKMTKENAEQLYGKYAMDV